MTEDQNKSEDVYEIEAIVNRIRDFQQDKESVESKITALKERLGTLLERNGNKWSDEKGYARLMNPPDRISYDEESLDALIISDPYRYGWLKDYRKQTPVPLPKKVHVK